MAQDSDSDVAILHVFDSPFERSMHMFAVAEDTETGKTEESTEKYWVPVMATDLATNGDEIVKIGFSSDSVPTINYDFGHISRVGADTSRERKVFRFHMSLPFKESDCGAPIINNAKTVIGMVHGVDTDTSTSPEPRESAIPSQYVLEALKTAK